MLSDHKFKLVFLFIFSILTPLLFWKPSASSDSIRIIAHKWIGLEQNTVGALMLHELLEKALEHLHQSSQDTAHRMGEHLGLNGEQVLTTFRKVEMPSITISRQYLQKNNLIEHSVSKILYIMLETQLIHKKDSLNELMTPQFINDED